MMGKRKARAAAMAGNISVGQLREAISSMRGVDGMSRVNPAFPLDYVLNIYMGALDGRPDDEVPKPETYDIYRERMKPSRDSMLVTNILRDCGPIAGDTP